MPSTVQLTATVPNMAAAEEIAALLLERRLTACVQVSGPVVSRYWWNGALEQAEEYVVVAKTTAALAADATKAILAAHPYDVPEVLETPVTGGNAAYLAWVAAEVAHTLPDGTPR